MLLFGTILICSSVVLFVVALLAYRNPRPTLIKRHDALGEAVALMIVACLFTGTVSLLLATEVGQPTGREFLYAGMTLLVSGIVVKALRPSRRLAAFDAETSEERVIAGNFQPASLSGSQEAPYRKAA